jgi:hypothetical protein
VKIAKYWKTVVAALVAGGTIAQAALTDDTITSGEWVAIGLAVLGALGVWAVPNKP